MSDYSKHYKDSRWQQKRLEIMERDNWTCRSCGAKGEGVTLNVHHAYYEKGKMPWEYENDMLVTWCEKCHEFRHRSMKNIQQDCLFMDLPAFNGLWLLARFNYAKTLRALDPAVDDKLLATIAEAIVTEAYERIEREAVK